MFQTLMHSQVYITLKIWINNKVTESPTIIVCHDKDCGQSASLQPSPITSKERRCLVNRLLKAAAACKVNRWVTGDNQPHHHEGKAVWKLETVRYHFTPHRWAKVPNLMMSSPAEDAVQQDHRCAEGSGELAPEDGKVMFSGEAGVKLHSATPHSHASRGICIREQQARQQECPQRRRLKSGKSGNVPDISDNRRTGCYNSD